MFEELYDSLSKLFSGRWPTADGEVTTATVNRYSGEGVTFNVEVAYKFCAGNDGPYSGLSVWTGARSNEHRALDAKKALEKGRSVMVRYRPDDPSVNKLDPSVWDGL